LYLSCAFRTLMLLNTRRHMSGNFRLYVSGALNLFFFSSRRRHTISVSAFLLNRSSDLVAKYVNKKSDMDLAAKGLGAKEWNNSLKTKLSLLPKKLFRIRMSRNFGMKMLTMTNLSTECLIQLTKLGYDAT